MKDASTGTRSPETASDLSRTVLDNLLEGCQVISPDYSYLYVNDAVVRHARTTRDALLGKTMMDCYPGIENTEMFAILHRAMETREPALMENEFEFPDGSSGWFELRFEPSPNGLTILSVEITERKRAEAALRRKARALATLSRSNQTLVRATDERQFMSDVCRTLVETGGYAAARVELSNSGAEPGDELVIAAGTEPASIEDRSCTVALEVRAKHRPIGTLTIHTDGPRPIDDEERAVLEEIALDLGFGIYTLKARAEHASTEAQLVAAQRLEAVGQLAGGVAHDFNNLLTAIFSFAQFAIDQLDESDPARQDVEEVVSAARRAASLTRQLLAFSRKQILEPEVLSLNSVIGGIESILRRLLGEDIGIEIHRAADLGNVLADPGQLEQVIVNLAVNARDAMPRGGKLTIETTNAVLDEEYSARHVSVQPGLYAQLSVSDTGIGMNKDTLDRIFEPFFTTKDSGGTGLGLSTAYGIVKQSGGNIWVYSEPGHGTTFKVYLPIVDDAPVAHAREKSSTVARGNETILLVEDEEAVRRAAERILSRAGYQVLTAANGDEALHVCAEHDGEIDLLLTDVVMPR